MFQTMTVGPLGFNATGAGGNAPWMPELPLVMTEKDAVKCRAFAPPGWSYLQVEAAPSAAFVAWFDEQLARLLPDHS